MSTNFDKFAILDSFVDEVASYLPEIEANLDLLQQQPGNQAAIEETYRRAHTIGGSAAMMDFSALAQVAQGMEAILGNALDGTAQLDGPTIALLRRSFGRLSRLLDMVRTGADGSQLLAEDDADHAASRGGAHDGSAPLNSAPLQPPPATYANGSNGSTGPMPAAGPAFAPDAPNQPQVGVQGGPQVPEWLSAFGDNGGAHGPTTPPAGAPGSQPSVDAMVQAFRANPTGPAPAQPSGYPPRMPQVPQMPGYPPTMAPGYGQGYNPGPAGAPPSGALAPTPRVQPGAKADPFAGSGIFDMPPELDVDSSGEADTARSLIAISPAWEVLANSEDALQQHVRLLRDIIGALREAASAMDDERAELRTFLDGSKDAIDRLEDWAGQAMGLDLRRSPEQVRRYLPLSVVWVTTTRLKKLVSLLNGSGRRLNTFQNELSDALRNLHVSINNVGRLYSSVAAVASNAQPNGDGGFTATVAQVTQVQFKPSAPTADEPTGPLPAVVPAQAPSLPPGARAEVERQVRDELRQELEDEVRGEIAAQVRDEETARLRHQIEIEVRRQVLSELSPGLGGAPVASVVVPSTPVTVSAGLPPPVPPTIPFAPRGPEPVRVSDQTAETLEVFREEAEEHLRNIALGIRDLEANPSDKGVLQSVRRATHTLKGAAGMMGFTPIEHLAHASEDLLDRLMDGGIKLTPDVQGLLLDTSEALERLVNGADPSAGADPRVMTSLQERYDRLLGSTAPRLATSGPLPPTATTIRPGASVPGEVTPEGAEGAPDADLTVRLRLSKLDEIINLFGDLLQSRSILEERIARMSGMVGDATRASERLQEIGGQLETRFEAATLPSGRGSSSALPPMPPAALDRALGGVQSLRGPGDGPAHLGEFHELELDRYTEFHRLSRGLSEGVTDMVTLSNEMESLLREVEGVFARESRLSSAFQDRLLKARLVPLQLMVPRLYRSTKAAAIKQGKDIEFLVQGGDTEVDRTVYEEVAGPLLHIVRNAVAHGIERPDDRVRHGKPAAGKIVLSASEQGNQVVITIQDDGAGIDTARISTMAISRGLIPPTTVLTPQQAQNLIFQPGFSTSESIDEESGRGVGLDVVKDAITRMRGTIEVSSDQGRGTLFTLRIPVSLQITRAVIVRLGKQTFAIPMNVIEQIGRLDYYERVNDRNGPAVEVRGSVYPLAQLASYLGLPPSRVEERSSLLLYNSGQRRMALLIDAIPNRQEIVVKSLGPHLRDVRGVSGATIGGDGKVVLLLNMDDLLAHPPAGGVATPELPIPNASVPRMPVAALPAGGTGPLTDSDIASLARITAAPQRSAPQPVVSPPPREMRPSMPIGGRRTAPPAPRPSYILVVDDSPSVRRVVSNTLRANGWEVQTARDGIEAVDVIARQMPAAVLLDIEMPRMDGYELMATLRSQPQYQNLPLVVLTSRAATKHQQRALQLGANAYVVKPYQDEDLIGTLDGLVAQQATR